MTFFFEKINLFRHRMVRLSASGTSQPRSNQGWSPSSQAAFIAEARVAVQIGAPDSRAIVRDVDVALLPPHVHACRVVLPAGISDPEFGGRCTWTSRFPPVWTLGA